MTKSKESKVPFSITNTDDGRKLKELIKEVSNHKTHIESHNDAMKEIRQRAVEELGIEPKKFNQLVSLYHADKREVFESERDEVVEIYDAIFK